ncbi:uncharacterized protein LOC105739128 [Nomascus leucogenys]|uniref:uncharacterized protein LOC105739128 n=1 Tax=Nomascus leucogenys TaxID=61853 RepID=UPI00062AB2B0|nr:uncharacterized protein LOC105739128 [Nomascus leucogenys]
MTCNPHTPPTIPRPAPRAESCMSPLSSHTFLQWHSIKCICFWWCCDFTWGAVLLEAQMDPPFMSRLVSPCTAPSGLCAVLGVGASAQAFWFRASRRGQQLDPGPWEEFLCPAGLSSDSRWALFGNVSAESGTPWAQGHILGLSAIQALGSGQREGLSPQQGQGGARWHRLPSCSQAPLCGAGDLALVPRGGGSTELPASELSGAASPAHVGSSGPVGGRGPCAQGSS